LLVAAVLVQTAWAAAMAATLSPLAPPRGFSIFMEAVRPAIWSCFLLAMLWRSASRTALMAGFALAVAVGATQLAALLFDLGAQERFGASLVAAVFTLLCVEQVYRNTPAHQRWAVKFLALALAAMFGFELVLFSDALLYGRVDFAWWAGRGYANALLAPLVAVTAARMHDWRLDIQVSRNVVFHSATLLASGLFLLTVAAIGYGLRLFGDAWGAVAQILVVFASVTALVALIASGRLRAQLRVLLAKHFFSYRYDYRSEWLKLTELIAQPERPGANDSTLSRRALHGLAALVDSPGGALWLRTEDGNWHCDASDGVSAREPIGADESLSRFLDERRWIVEIPEWNAHPERYGALVLPQWLVSDPEAWLIVPLVLDDKVVGLAQLQRPVASAPLDWEVRDVLKTAGRQVAGYLAVRQAVEKLVQARQFDSFNRMSAFVVHDLKNLVAQLALLVKNAARHRDNPEFQRDMLETVENVLDRMQGLLLQLRVGTRPIEQAAPLPLGETLRDAVAAKKGLHLETELDIAADAERVEVVAHRDRLERVVGHLLQNAIEATPPGGNVRLAARRTATHAIVEVTDTGRGMSREFVEKMLFKPFTSTKENGMGIGAFESREYVLEIGGHFSVASAECRGTTITIQLPLVADHESIARSRAGDPSRRVS
jgi:putative PEP-CTERM system histidine kinase